MRPRRGQVRPDGFRSGFEAQVAKDLDKRKINYKYEAYQFLLDIETTRPNTKCKSCGKNRLVTRHRYTPDFCIRQNFGNTLFVEAKGRFTAKDRRLALAFQGQVPMATHGMLFMRDNKLSKSSKTKYSDWCKANGIEFAIGPSVPKEWLK